MYCRVEWVVVVEWKRIAKGCGAVRVADDKLVD
jgi:hypothetical protein